MTAVLETKGLTKAFGAIVAVDNVSFSLDQGELLALIGPNGAGKSTCFNMLMGQLKPTSGDVFLADEKITGMLPRDVWRKGVGRTFQITATYASMTVIENVQMALISHHREIMRFLPFAHTKYRAEDKGVSVLFTEHDMDVVFAHSHRIMVLNRGQLIAEGNAAEIRNNEKVQEVYLGGGTVFGNGETTNA